MAEAEEQLRWIEERIARQDEFEHAILSKTSFNRAQKEVRLLATRRVTLSQIRDSIEAYRSWERKQEPVAATHSHDHEWGDPCTSSCPWRQALINDVTKEADHGTRTE